MAKKVVPDNNGGYVNSDNETLIVDKPLSNLILMNQKNEIVKEEESFPSVDKNMPKVE